MTTLRISRVHYPVDTLGYGRRLGIWVQGCPLACAGCMSRDTWPVDAGLSRPVAELIALAWSAMAAGADGLTISGGEPLAQARPLAEFLRGVHNARTSLSADSPSRRDFDIMLYTGYDLDELTEEQRAAAELADLLITGRYRVAEPTGLIWRGSANQAMHLQTPLGRARYESFVDFTPEHPPLQLEAEPDGTVVLIGVPRRGTLQAIEAALREHGIAPDSVSWRRPRDDGRGPESLA